MRFRCPSTSVDIIEPSIPAVDRHLSRLTLNQQNEGNVASVPNSTRKPHKKCDRGKRKRSGVDTAKKAEIAMAWRKEAIRKQMKRKELSFIFVGNIDPSADESSLHKLFIRCGPISHLQIRCSRGRGVTIGRAIPAHFRTSRDRQYATVEFVNACSVKKALRLDGTVLSGLPLVVCLTAADLPEVQDIVHDRLGTYMGPTPQARRIPIEGTEKILDENSTQNTWFSPKPLGKNVIMDYSFPLCVA